MRISDRYIGKQVLLSTVFAIAVLAVVLMFGSLFKEIRPFLTTAIPWSVVGQVTLDVLPVALMFTIPWGFLAAVMLVFGRLSSDQELTGFRVAGISLPRLAAPVFVIAIALCALCTWLNVWIAPRAEGAIQATIQRQVLLDPRAMLDPGAVQAKFPNEKVFVESKDGSALVGFHMYKTPKEKDPDQSSVYIHARRVDMLVDQPTQEFHLVLDGAYIETRNAKGDYEPAFTEQAKYLPLSFNYAHPLKPKAGNMTGEQIATYLTEAIHDPRVSKRTILGFRTEIARRYSQSFACLSFALVGVPLALKARRRDTSTGLLLSMLLGAAYFLCFFFANQFTSEKGMLAALWAPNVVCVILGLWLFRRARFR